MKHLIKYEGYSTKERVDYILDKILKYGIGSISDIEKDFLDAHSTGEEELIHNKMKEKESETIFEDDDGLFRFELKETKKELGETYYIGTLYVPDIEFENGKTIKGILRGQIIVYSNSISLDFSHRVNKRKYYDVFEFCEGVEYELDSFVDYVVSKLEGDI